MKKSKSIIGNKTDLKDKNPLSGVKAEMVRAFIKEGYEENGTVVAPVGGVLLEFDYTNQQQIDAMKNLYGDPTQNKYYVEDRNCVEDINICGISQDGSKVDFMGISFCDDIILDAVLKKLVEKDGINLSVGQVKVQGSYDNKTLKEVHEEIKKLIVIDEMLYGKDGGLTK